MARTDEERFKVQFARLRREKEKAQSRLSAERYQKLVRQFKEQGLARERRIVGGQIRKGYDPELYETQKLSEIRRQRVGLKRFEEGLRRSDIAFAKKEAERAMTTGFQRATSKLPIGVRRLDTKVGTVARKAIYLLAPKGFVKTITRPTGKGSGRGRGRPRKTYKERYVPGIGRVKVPTAVYNKMMSSARRERRLAAAQQQARYNQQMEAEQIAITQDPRFEQSRDRFLEDPDMQHEQNVITAEERQRAMANLQQMEQQQQPQRQNIFARFSNGLRRFGTGVNRMGQPRGQPRLQGQIQGQPPQIHRPQSLEESRELIKQRNILNAPSVMFGGGQTQTGTQLSLMGSEIETRRMRDIENYKKDLQRRVNPNYGKSSILMAKNPLSPSGVVGL